MGNSVKLPGLTQYLSKNLAMDVEVVDGFSRLSGGDDVLSAPAFKDHIASFAPAYGLCLQGLGLGPLQTNLVPQEIVKERLIRSKKPWAVAAAGLLMTGFAASLIPQGSNYAYVHPSKWNAAASAAERTKSTSDSQISEDEKQKNQIDILKTIGNEVSGGGERRIVWMEVVAALLDSVGREEKFDLAALPDPVEVPYSDRTDIHITKLDCKRVEDLTAYLQKTNRAYEDDKKVRLDLLGLLKLPEVDENGEAAETTEEEAPDPLAILAPAEGEESDEQDLSGVVIEIAAFHYHNGEKYAPTNDEREEFVIKTWLHELETGSVKLPDPSTGEMVEFTYKELGLLRPMIIPGTYNPEYKILNPEWVKKHGKPAGAGGGMGGPGMGGPGMGGPGMGGPGMGGGGYGEGDGGYGEGDGYGGGGYGGAGSGAAAPKPEDDEDVPKQFDAPKFEFKLQIVWRPKLFSDRMEAKKRAAEAAAEAAALEGDLASDETVDDGAGDAGS
jgi:type IV pilus assembly protein PilM